MNSPGARRIVLGVSGGIAAYKAAELTRLLVKDGADVHVVLTAGGAHFVTAVTFQALSGNRVWTDLWDPLMSNNMAHIDLTRGAAALLTGWVTDMDSKQNKTNDRAILSHPWPSAKQSANP